ncbi:GntR family transcriptional regulator [Acuticoccus sediminis]|uniref:GntR family transcriptional regulator n=1 Tax=Acuticoccus sediminis TaxID=2184697 RepID=UPI00192E31A5|nr:GntR family transcriptional regulator [Acuticoccus sediminis]
MRDTTKGKATVAGRVADRLREQILLGQLEPGRKLKLDALRDSFGISVSSLREAVTRLVADGLLVAEEQKGYTVAPISLANLDEVTRLRMELEPLALRAAIANGGLDWETDVTAAVYRLNHTVRVPGDAASVEAWELAHNAFHLALIDRCDMPLLLSFHRTLMNMNDRYRRIFMARSEEQRDVTQEHAAIAEAATRRDGEAAAALLAAHIDRTGAALRKMLQDALPETAR